MISKRQVVSQAVEGKTVPYVPWHCSFTLEACEKLKSYFNSSDLDGIIGNHFLQVSRTLIFEDIGNSHFRDNFGVTWDRSRDKDIGVVCEYLLKEPTLEKFKFPAPDDERIFEMIPQRIKKSPDLYRIFSIGFSLYERAWALRGMENLMIDFYENSKFACELLHKIADYNIAMIKNALAFDIDAVYFGDDWGQQHGLQMGPKIFYDFIFPELKRMYAVVKQAQKHVFIHSCGDVDELFDDLINIGVNCFNPFQPEVMDVFALIKKYKGRLAFHGGLSTQKILPYGTPCDVRNETIKLLQAGKDGGYIFAPAHAVESDVPLENMLAFLEVLQKNN